LLFAVAPFKTGIVSSIAYQIEPGMKVAVRRGVVEHVGVVMRLEGEHVVVRWTQSKERSDELEFRAHRDDVKPLEGWV
jgi:hypothetical protein